MQVVQIVLWYLDSGCSKHMTGNRSRLMNFVKKFIGIVRSRNDHFGAIMGQFCNSNLEVAFRKHSCYVRTEDGVDLLSRGSNLYTVSVEDMMKSSPICLLSKASKNKSWLWHRQLNHLNFGTINDLARKDLVRGLPRLKFEKDHLCSACQLGKRKKYTHKPKSENTIIEVLHTLHMDLCGPMRVQSINWKKYLLVIMDDYSRFTQWHRIVNQVLTEYYENVSIFHQKSVLRTPQQNGVVKIQNRTLVEAARTMLIFLKAPMLQWAEAVATACYTQNRSLIHIRLVPDPVPEAPYVPLTNKDLDILFQPMFDEYLEPHNVKRPVPPTPAAQVLVVSAGTPSSTIIDQDASSTKYSPSSSVVQPLISHQGVAVGPTIEDNPFAQADNDPFVNDESSFRDASSAESTQVTQPHNHLRKWSKDHPLDNVISNPSRLVSTKKQLATDALWCLYNSILTKVEPNNVKTAMDEACWFEAMQEEIHEFDRLQVWELVPKPNCVTPPNWVAAE
ncbi:retrovirus-related pol polyprotein from transposon TNT 1-94 [Tanacetum coccineum]